MRMIRREAKDRYENDQGPRTGMRMVRDQGQVWEWSENKDRYENDQGPRTGMRMIRVRGKNKFSIYIVKNLTLHLQNLKEFEY